MSIGLFVARAVHQKRLSKGSPLLPHIFLSLHRAQTPLLVAFFVEYLRPSAEIVVTAGTEKVCLESGWIGQEERVVGAA